MTRVAAPRLPLIGLASCLNAAGIGWEQTAYRLRISPATLRSYTSRGAPLSMITALTLLLDLPNHSARLLFVRTTEGLRVHTAVEPHRAHPHQPALRRAGEHVPILPDLTSKYEPRASQFETGAIGPAAWQQMPLDVVTR